MPHPVEPTEQPQVPARVVPVAGVSCIIMGATALAGWALGIPMLHRISLGMPHLTVNGAYVFLWLGAALLLVARGDTGRFRPHYRLGQAAAFLVAVVGALTLGEYLFKRNFGIDQWLFNDPFAAARGGIPGRPSFPAALNAMLLGLGMGLLDVRFRRVWLAQPLVVASVLISLLAAIGYACNVPEFYAQADRRRGNGVSLHDVGGFLVLAAGLLCSRPHRGLVAVMWSHTPGGMLARCLLAAPAAGLLLTGVVYLVLDRGFHVDHAIRTWALGLSNLIFVTAPIWIAAHGLHRVGLERDHAYQLLEERVQQRTMELTQANAALQAEIAERRQAEEALRLSEERYRIVADNTYAMEYWLGPDGEFVYVSPSCERITGYTPDQFVARPELLGRLVHADDRKLLHNGNIPPKADPVTEQAEFRLVRHDGTVTWVAHHSRPLFDAGGRFLGRRGSIRDVTERKRAEARMLEERDFSDALVDSLPGVFYLFDAEGKLLRWNKNLERLANRSAEQIAQMQPQDFFAGSDRRMITERIAQAFRTGECTAETMFPGPDGTRRTYFFTGQRLELQQGPCVVGLGLEITERKRAEEGLLERDRELRLVMDSGPTLISYVDARGRYRRVNRGYSDWYGVDADAVRGRRVQEVLGQVAWQVVQPYVRRALAGEVVSYEQELPLPGGRRWIQATYTPDKDANGVVRGFVVHALDIEERKRAEEALRDARDRLEAQAGELERRVADRTARLRETIGDLEAFSYSVAHDMRAPLRGMQGFARLLLDEHAAGLNAEARGYLERIASSAARMDMLIQDVLNYTRVLRTETPLGPVDLNRLVHHLNGTYPVWQAPAAQILIEGEFPSVLGHEGFLTQCISNLVSNGIKFVAPGMTPRLRIWAETRGPNVLLWVEDNGIGIAPKDHDRIFRMFERLNPFGQYEGTGIGLTIVRKAAERMGGRVGFESELGKGSRFWLELHKTA